MQLIHVRVLRNRGHGGGYRHMELHVPDPSFAPVPGQFVHLRVPGLEATALRRPFSIYDFEQETLHLLFKPVGRGTRLLENASEGDGLNLMGPLGNGFPEKPEPGNRPVLIAGGYGVAPLYFLARRMAETGDVLLGARGSEDILCEEEFRLLGWRVRVATEDGSRGKQGRVTDLLDDRQVLPPEPQEWFSCGPEAMLRSVAERAKERGITAWLSLDKRMGCGIGACLACVQAVRDAEGTVSIARVCRDGPIFEAGRIVWGQP